MKETARRPAPETRPAEGGVLVQRRCSCSAGPSATGCAECDRKKKVQTRLAVSQPGDAYEIEADRIASAVVDGRQASPAGAGAPVSVQRVANASGVEAGGDAGIEAATRGPGRAIEAPVRQSLEARFGHSFADVRVHTDGEADRSARALQADAYTIGSDVVFAAGRYAPATRSGLHLLAHELTHVLQQSTAAGASTGRTVFRHAADKSRCLGDPEWKRIDASPQEIYMPANDAIERAYKDKHGSNAVLTGSQFEYGGKPGSSAIELPKGAPAKGACNSLLKNYSGVSRQLAPDIMDCTDRVFYEIKTNKYAGSGASQLKSYYKLANELAAQEGDLPWNIDFATWYPPHVIQLEPTRRVCTEGTDYGRTQHPGLIIYEVQDHKDRKQRKKEEEEKKKADDTRTAKEKAEAEALRKAQVKKVKEFVEQLERELDHAEGDNRAQKHLIEDPSYFGFWGYWTNELFNAQPPPLSIWNDAYAHLEGAKTQIKAGNPTAALTRFAEARKAFLAAVKTYHAWKDKLPGAATKMQTAIGVAAVVALAAFVAPTVVSRIAARGPSAAKTASNLVKAEEAVSKAAVRIAAGESRIAAYEAALAEAEIISAANLEAEMFVLRLLVP